MLLRTLIKLVPIAAFSLAPATGESVIPLAGEWRFQLDADQSGIKEKWFAGKLTDKIRLPGTTDENKKGILTQDCPEDRLARVWFWKGQAWYQREVTIPPSWAGKRVTLFCERTKHSRLWVDETPCGWENSLCAPHVFDVSDAMTPGTHTITLLVDNGRLPPVGPSHAVDERTQTNWNGIVGRIELRATDPFWIDDVQVFPNASKREARVRVTVGNRTGKPAAGTLTVGCTSHNVQQPAGFAPHAVEVQAAGSATTVEFVYQPGEGVPLWDEFHPALLRLDLDLAMDSQGRKCFDRHSVSFGMRDFTREGNRLLVNGKPVFLRGRVDCANFPLTGYAPMDKKEWLRLLRIQKDWGLNHIRFHSWCPPPAAFEAADELGFYLQPELPNKRSAFNAPESGDAAHWNIDYLELDSTEADGTLYEFSRREGKLIFRHFGNHPSFTMFTLGNELGRNPGMFEMVGHFKALGPRQLHAQGANNMHWDPSLAEGDDFWITAKAGKQSRPIRGAFSMQDFLGPHIECRPPSTMVDYSESISGIPVPMISHETGSFQVSPDFRDIPKFTGVLAARNYGIFRERLKAAGMLDQSHDFVRASGALAAICYREDIEAPLRTPDLGGFQLLDIMDFPGQGTALVGMLNVFMEEKGIISPEAWRRFCSETVPLLRMKKYTWTTDETFIARVEVAHYGPADLPDARVTWTLAQPGGRTLAQGALTPLTLVKGRVNEVDMFALPLSGLEAPSRLELSLAIDGTPYRNIYPLWIYPPQVDVTPAADVMIARSFSDVKTREYLAAGGKVLLLPPLDKLPHSVPGAFQNDYWSPMFAQSAIKRGLEPPPGTLGILCDPSSPALAAFPTEFHSNWQWWHLVKNSRPLILDDSPADFRPSVQVIDNFARNHKLGLLVETKVGKGSMLVCPINLLAHQDKPEVRQFLHSLLQYLRSPGFSPKHELDSALLLKLLPP